MVTEMTRHLQNLAIALLLIGYVIGCATKFNPPADQPPAEKQPLILPAATDTKGKVEAIKPPLAAATQLAPKLTPANVEAEKPTLIDHLNRSWTATLAAIASARAMEAKAESADKASAVSFERERKKDAALADAARTIQEQNAVVADLQGKLSGFWHSVTTWVFALGMGMSFVLVVLGVYLSIKGDIINGLAAGGSGAAGLITGIVFMTIADFFEAYKLPIGIGLCVVIAGVLAVVGYFAYHRLRASTVAAAKLIQTGIITGAVDFNKLAPLARTIETPLLAGIVNKTTSKDDRAKAVAASDVNGLGNVALSRTGGTD